MAHAVVISGFGARGPYGGRLRIPEPASVACLWTGSSSANWVFTSLAPNDQGGSVRPCGPEDAASALLVGIALYVLEDEKVRELWQSRTGSDGEQPDVSQQEDGALVMASREVVGGQCRVSVIHDSSGSDSMGFIKSLGEMKKLDFEVMVTPENLEVSG